MLQLAEIKNLFIFEIYRLNIYLSDKDAFFLRYDKEDARIKRTWTLRKEKRSLSRKQSCPAIFTIDRPCRQIGVNYTCAYVILDKLSGEKKEKK